MTAGAEKQPTDQAILAAVLWPSPSGTPYTLKHLIDDWSQNHAVKQLPRVTEHPERAVPYIRGKFCAAVRSPFAQARDAREREARKDRGLVTPERLAKGDLTCDIASDTSGVVTEAQRVDATVAARMLAEGLLRPEHETAVRRFRALREAYDSLSYARQGLGAAGGITPAGERMMADDYLWLRKRQSEFDREAVEFACFREAKDWNFAMIRGRSEKYARAFDRLAGLFGELDKLREAEETACASPPVVAS